MQINTAHQAACEATSISRIPFLGQKAPACYEALGRALGVLEIAACCGFGCPGHGDPHLIQRLLGRAVSNSNASLALALSGYYDESIALTRSVGEVANLLWLFANRAGELERWRSLDRRLRWREFRPAGVPRKLRDAQEVVLVEEDDYTLLSEVGTHVVLDTAPQTLSVHRRPTVGGFYREDALVVGMNELAWAIGVTTIPGATLILTGDDRKRLLTSGGALLETFGGLRLRRLQDFWTNAAKPDPA